MSKKIKFTIILAIIFILFLAVYQFINKEEFIIDNENIENTNYIENKVENEVQKEEAKVDIEEKNKIITQISPSGFMGSSMYKVILYSNKEVYLVVYNGNGYEEKNKVSEELIAKNVNSIKIAEDDENYGEIIVTGGTVINSNIGWIKFE